VKTILAISPSEYQIKTIRTVNYKSCGASSQFFSISLPSIRDLSYTQQLHAIGRQWTTGTQLELTYTLNVHVDMM